MPMIITGQEQVAEMFGKAPKTIVEWQAQGMPVAERGGPGVPSQYDAAACIAWLVEREVAKVQGESPRDRLFRLQAEELELKLAEKRGQLIPASAVEPRLEAAIVAAREQLLAEAPRLSMLVQGRDRAGAEDLLLEAFERFLTRLANWQAANDDEEVAGS